MPARYELDFDERFVAPVLDPSRWVAHYLPEVDDAGALRRPSDLEPGPRRLRIEADLRVSADPSTMLTFWLVGFQQRIAYPLQLMVDLFEFPDSSA